MSVTRIFDRFFTSRRILIPVRRPLTEPIEDLRRETYLLAHMVRTMRFAGRFPMRRNVEAILATATDRSPDRFLELNAHMVLETKKRMRAKARAEVARRLEEVYGT